jgi:hypothetical protein
MNRALLVLALAVFSSAGCRAVGNRGGCGCGDSCAVGGPSGQAGCGDACAGCADGSCASGCGGGACGCPAGGCNCFGRFCNNSGCGVQGPHDCSACNSSGWGNDGHGYCPDGCRGMCGGRGPMLRSGYCLCCGRAAPSCCCSSGDHNYNFAPGPPVGQTAYPYYTVRGPRDFLLGNPPNLGPY